MVLNEYLTSLLGNTSNDGTATTGTTNLTTTVVDSDLFRNAVSILSSLGIQLNDLCAQTTIASEAWQVPLCDDNEFYNHAATQSIRHLQEVLSDGATHLTDSSGNIAAVAVALPSMSQEEFYIYNVLGTIFCIGCVALISGLYLGLLTVDAIDLEIIQRVSIDDDEIMYATNLLPIVKQRHRLLVTLLILNTVTMETLPVFLNNIVPNWVAILLSTTLILMFGEIIPSAIFAGPNQLYLGNQLAPLTKFFMWLLTPLTTPLVAILDYLVHGGHHDTKLPNSEPVYNRNELAALVRIQHESRMAAATRNNKSVSMVKNRNEFKEKKKDESWNAIKKEIIERASEKLEVISERNHRPFSKSHHEEDIEIGEEQLNPPLHPKEVDLVTGALQMKTRLVMDEFTPLRKVYALPNTLILNLHTVAGIYAKGYSRIPVYEVNPNDPDDKTLILGFFLIRQLILIDWDHEREISTLPLQRPDCISPRTNLVDAMELLRTGGTLMAFVCARPEIANRALDNEQPIPPEAGFMGIITLEDVMESILQGRIHDEWDVKDRDRAIATLHRWAATKLQALYRKKRSVEIAKQLRSTGSFGGGGGGAGSVASSPTKEIWIYRNSLAEYNPEVAASNDRNATTAPSSNTTNTNIQDLFINNNSNNHNIMTTNGPSTFNGNNGVNHNSTDAGSAFQKYGSTKTFDNSDKLYKVLEEGDIISSNTTETSYLLKDRKNSSKPPQSRNSNNLAAPTTPLLQVGPTGQGYTFYD